MGGILPLLAVAAVFVGLLLAGTFLYWSLRTEQEARRDELSRRLGIAADEHAVQEAHEGSATVRALGGLGRALHALTRRAGADLTVERLLVQMLLFGGVGLLLSARLLRGPQALLGLFLGAIPLLFLLRGVRARQALLARQLPDALDLIGRSLRAGHALSDAIRIASAELSPPTSVEFSLLSEEHRLGVDLRDALAHLIERNPESFDLRLFASAVLLQRETGGNLIEILRHLSDTIRERFVFETKVMALTAEVRLSAAILAAMPFVVGGILLVLRPGYLNPLFTTDLGKALLVAGGSALVLGIALMRRLARVRF